MVISMKLPYIDSKFLHLTEAEIASVYVDDEYSKAFLRGQRFVSGTDMSKSPWAGSFATARRKVLWALKAKNFVLFRVTGARGSLSMWSLDALRAELQQRELTAAQVKVFLTHPERVVRELGMAAMLKEAPLDSSPDGVV